MSALERWKLAVMELDDYTCQLCGTNKHLDAHHIIARSQDPSKALDPANGVTLCRRDHGYFETHRAEFAQWLAHWQEHGRLAGYWFTEYMPDPAPKPHAQPRQIKRTNAPPFTDDWVRQQNDRLAS